MTVFLLSYNRRTVVLLLKAYGGDAVGDTVGGKTYDTQVLEYGITVTAAISCAPCIVVATAVLLDCERQWPAQDTGIFEEESS